MHAPERAGTAISTDTWPDISARTARMAILALWLACAGLLIWADYKSIALMTFNDPDDALRLVEVRDWLGGQSWFDVTQYRSQPPSGAPMHWSRLVDIPIAALIRLGALVAPMAQAERFALVTVPLLLFLLLGILVHMLTIAATGRRLIGVVAVGMLMASLGIIIQFKPLRIDHHGWQIVLGTLTVLLLLRAVQGTVRYTALAGLTAALALAIALEGLPLVVAIGGVFGMLYLRDAARGPQLTAYLGVMLIAGTLLLLAMLGWSAATVPWCDALSPAILGPLGVALLIFATGRRFLPQSPVAARLALLALAGAGAALTFRLATPVCAAGPFAALDPLVARLWYLNVMEGMPLWVQPSDLIYILPLPAILGLIATMLAIWLDEPKRRDGWIALLIVQTITFILSLLILRSMGLAHVLALPASAWLFIHAFSKTRRLSTPVGRIAAGFACFALTPIGAEAMVMAFIPENRINASATNGVDPRSICTTHDSLRGLDALPPSRLFTPLDIGAHLLLFTHHSIIASGHHRARWGMKAVISAFIAPPDEARRIIAVTGSDYVVICDKEPEVKKYAKLYPASLTAVLLKDRPPVWLARVPMRPGETIRVWRIRR